MQLEKLQDPGVNVDPTEEEVSGGGSEGSSVRRGRGGSSGAAPLSGGSSSGGSSGGSSRGGGGEESGCDSGTESESSTGPAEKRVARGAATAAAPTTPVAKEAGNATRKGKRPSRSSTGPSKKRVARGCATAALPTTLVAKEAGSAAGKGKRPSRSSTGPAKKQVVRGSATAAKDRGELGRKEEALKKLTEFVGEDCDEVEGLECLMAVNYDVNLAASLYFACQNLGAE